MADKMLVIVPLKPMYGTWPTEIDKYDEFKHLTWCFLHGPNKDERLESADADIYLINPEGIPWLTSRMDPSKLADVLCVDESTKFKNPSSKRFKILKKMLPSFSRRYILTGTPTSQGLEDLFGQIYILDGGAALGSYITHYRRKYFYQTGYGGYTYEPRDGAADEIAAAIGGFTLRLKAEDYLELPELVYNEVAVDLPAEVRLMYQELEREFLAVIADEEITAPTAAAVSTKLRQLVNGGVYNDERDVVEVHKAKITALTELHEELGKAPMLVMYQFKHDIARIREELGDVPYIGSGVSNKLAEQLCRQFNDGTLPLLLAHPASVGHGLNLQGHSNHIAFFGLPWDYELREQAIRRVYRQGNPNTHVFIHDIVARKTIDQAVARALNRKETNQEGFLRALKSYSGE
jgi:SNF2 family DNA or RNA helicase